MGDPGRRRRPSLTELSPSRATAWEKAGRRAPVLVLALGLLAMVAALVRAARTLWFFGDDWDFLAERELGSVDDLLRPHNEHWSTLPIIAFRVMYRIFGLDSYLPYALLPIAAHIVVVGGLYAVLRRSGVGDWGAATAALLVAFVGGGSGAENTLWDFQIGFLGSAALGVLALLTAQLPSRRPRVATVALLVLSLMASGMGLFMVAWVCLLVLFREGLRSAVLTGVGPAAIYLAWYLAYGRGSAVTSTPDLAAVPEAALTGMFDLWSVALGVAGTGTAILLALVVAVLVPRHSREVAAVGLAGLVALILMYAVIGFSRVELGIPALHASRYVYFGVLLCAGAFAVAVDGLLGRLRRHHGTAGWCGALLVVLIGAVGLAQLEQFRAERQDLVHGARARLAAAVGLAAQGAPLLGTAPNLVMGWNPELDNLEAAGAFEVLRRFPTSPHDVLHARSALQVDASPSDLGLPAATSLGWYGFPGVPDGERPLEGCQTAHAGEGARLEVASGRSGGAQVGVQVDGTFVQTVLATPEHASLVSTWDVEPGERTWVGTTAPGVTLRIHVQPGPVTVCPAPVGATRS